MLAPWIHPAKILNFATFFPNRLLIVLLIVFGFLLNSTFDDFLYLLHHFSEHGFCIVFSSIWYDLLYNVLNCFDTFSARVRNLRNLQNQWFYNEFEGFYFTIQENMNFDIFNDFFRYTNFGIDF